MLESVYLEVETAHEAVSALQNRFSRHAAGKTRSKHYQASTIAAQ